MELNEIISLTKEIASTIVQDEVGFCDKNYQWHEKGMKAMQDAGLAGLVIPIEYGGLGQGLYGLAKVCEVLGAVSPSMGICFGMHCVGSAVIASKATEYQVENFLKPICEGKHITTLTLSEPGTGAHFYYPQTTVISNDNDTFSLNGVKSFSTNGNKADSYVVSTVAASPEAAIGNFSCVLVENNVPGLEWGGEWNGIGMRGNSSLTLKLDNVQIPKENLLGDEGDQIWYVFNVVAPYFLIAMSGTYLGISNSAFEQAKNHLTHRVHSHNGLSLSQNQLLQHRLGEIWTELKSTEKLIEWAAKEGDSAGELSVPALCSAKAKVAKTAVKLVNEAMTICGGKGYQDGEILDRLLRDSRAADVMAPTTDLLFTWVGRALLEEPILD